MELLLLFIIRTLMYLFANIVSKFKVRPFGPLLFTSIVFGLLVGLPQNMLGQRGSRIRTVVIDAGHGGKDPGALGKHSREKDITLAVALKVGRYIQQNLKDVKVIYTRTTDRFIPLYQRAEIANKNHADVFISIHCNSNPSSKPYGTESYVIGLSKSKANLEVAKAENAAILYEDNPRASYDGFDINSPQSYINLSLFQNTYLTQSLNLAHLIENQVKYRLGRKARGVFQAGFLVLWRTTMPSVLVELGFLSNHNEEAFLLSQRGQAYLASAIYRAFKSYKQSFEKENAVSRQSSPAALPAKKSGVNPVKKILNQSVTSHASGVEYRVQFYTGAHLYKSPFKKFPQVTNIEVYRNNGAYKYTSGHFTSISKAAQHQKVMRQKGYRDAFVVAFYQQKRISLGEARKLKLAGK